MIIEYLIGPMLSFILWDTQLNNTSFIYTYALIRDKEIVTIEGKGCEGSTMPNVMGTQRQETYLFLQRSFVGGSTEESFKEFPRLTATFPKWGASWTKK